MSQAIIFILSSLYKSFNPDPIEPLPINKTVGSLDKFFLKILMLFKVLLELPVIKFFIFLKKSPLLPIIEIFSSVFLNHSSLIILCEKSIKTGFPFIHKEDFFLF